MWLRWPWPPCSLPSVTTATFTTSSLSVERTSKVSFFLSFIPTHLPSLFWSSDWEGHKQIWTCSYIFSLPKQKVGFFYYMMFLGSFAAFYFLSLYSPFGWWENVPQDLENLVYKVPFYIWLFLHFNILWHPSDQYLFLCCFGCWEKLWKINVFFFVWLLIKLRKRKTQKKKNFPNSTSFL